VSERIEGRNPVREALRAGRPIRRVLIAEGTTGDAVGEIIRLARAGKVRVDRVPRAVLESSAVSRAHQGVVAEVEPYRFRSWSDALELARARGEPPLILAIDGVTDPGNLGSLLRSAETAGAHGVIVGQRRTAPITPVVEKAAAGALSHLIVDRVPNLGTALGRLREEGLWTVGLAASAPGVIWECDLLAEPLVVIVGAEGKGLSRLISERADALVSIPLKGAVGSLNAAVAGAIALFEVGRRRHPQRPSDGP